MVVYAIPEVEVVDWMMYLCFLGTRTILDMLDFLGEFYLIR